MHLACALLILATAGCSSPEGLWRDQYIFAGDDGTVMFLGCDRRSAGNAEAKGLLGLDGRWRASLWHRFPIARSHAPDLEHVLLLLSTEPGTPAHVTVERDDPDGAIRIAVRVKSVALRFESPALAPLGESVDPEGASVYRAGRASLSADGKRREGWLLVEETPKKRPRRPFVEFGDDFVFIAAAAPGRGPLVLKRSLQEHRFDHAFVGSGADAKGVRHTTAVRAAIAKEEVAVELPELGVRASLTIRDRFVGDGVSPAGVPLQYATLLLGGDYAGVAVLIRPAARGAHEP